MKILSLKLKNINSLKGEHSIDFANGPLAEAGLFAITGPTGSGKSTLLDAITLALYNRIPRVSGAITKTSILELGVILTQHTQDCYAEVHFEVNDQEYRANWSIEMNRNGNLNERKHEIVNALTGEIITNSISETPKEIEKIIGLSYEQFVQSMMLAQGQFAKFLQANKNERSKLLEEITGGQIYRKIGRAVYEKFKSVKATVDNTEEVLSNIQILPEEEKKQIQEESKKMETALKDLEKNEKLYESEISLRNAIEKEKSDLNSNLHQLDNVKGLLNKKESDKIKLTQHDRLAVYRDALANIRQLEAEVKIIIKQKDAQTDKLNTAKENRKQSLLDAEKLLQSVVNESELEIQLQKFSDKINELTQDEKEKFKSAKTLQEEIEKLIKILNVKKIELPSNEQILDDVKTHISQINAQKEQFGVENIEKLEAKIYFKRYLSADIASYIPKENAFLAKQEKFNDEGKICYKLELERDSENEKVQEIQKNLSELEPEFESLKKEVDEFNKQKSLEHYRAELKDGEPCPLCGSLEHPLANNLVDNIMDEKIKRLENLDDLIKSKKLALNYATKKIDDLNSKIKEKNDWIDDNVDILREEWEEIEKDLKSLENRYVERDYDLTWQDEWKKINLQISDLEKLQNRLQALEYLNDLESKLIQYQEVKEDYQKIKKQREQHYAGKDVNKDCANIREQYKLALQAFEDAKNNLNELNEKLQGTQEILEKSSKELLQKVEPEGIQSLDELSAKILDETTVQQIRNELNALTQKEAELKAGIEIIKKGLEEKQKEQKTAHPLPELKHLLAEVKTQQEEKNEALISLKTQLKTDEQNQERHRTLSEELATIQQKLDVWKRLNDLIGDATGNRFSNYVQDLTLRQLLVYANQRLHSLTQRYQIYLPESHDKTDTLQILDLHLGSTRRSINSLSGGETFKVSLAMALGLSDLAAQNVCIDSLFIDEGFGSLDPDSLNEAISLLEEMQSNTQKSIGIISHVTELKERITTQVKLSPTGNGYSKISVEV